MTTTRRSTATIHPGQDAQTYSAPRCTTCGGRRARRLDTYGAGQPRADAKAKVAAIRLGNGADVHFSLADDCYAVVRAVDPTEGEVAS
ncbi:hypothetical protein ACM01_15060 [Streptomyces viridochromogenes]|uniref:Uncharacterized protein n=1 Tax=Streptomyces viridochromogenes TaxID=1938 RepID=A0A0J7ZEG9_STRVR|nr:hypothetical protein [Streptomyces viridochromogenes]KMS74234.1 hypothetical protein ACM01_15060 [Streptomyces viridochromogenes]